MNLARECLEGGADVNKREGGWTPLHFAASKNSPDVGRCEDAEVRVTRRQVAQLLVESRADINAFGTKDGWTALVWACR